MQEKKKVELKRWRKEVREKKWPVLNCRKKFWRVLIENQRHWEQLPNCNEDFREDKREKIFGSSV